MKIMEMMKEKRFILLLTVTLLVSTSMAGCARVGNPTGQTTGNTGTDVSYEVVEDLTSLPEIIRFITDDFKARRGFGRFIAGDNRLVVISMGEKPTAGYAIKVLKVEDVDGTDRITVEEQSPGKDDIVAQVISYPLAAVRLSGKTRDVAVTVTGGLEYTLLADSYFEGIGKYVGQIDNNSIEIDVDKNPDIEGSGNPMAFRFSQKTMHYFDTESTEYLDLKTSEKVRFAFYKNEFGQLILMTLERV